MWCQNITSFSQYISYSKKGSKRQIRTLCTLKYVSKMRKVSFVFTVALRLNLQDPEPLRLAGQNRKRITFGPLSVSA